MIYQRFEQLICYVKTERAGVRPSEPARIAQTPARAVNSGACRNWLINGDHNCSDRMETCAPNKLPDGRMLWLDAMRGAAALVVVLHHVWPMATNSELLSRGYISVDFFFMLSGFVMTRSYEGKFRDGLLLLPFMIGRLRRLYPVMAVGICVGALAAVSGGLSPDLALPILIEELLFLPRLDGGRAGIFLFDGVQWSLLFELLANIAHQRVLAGLRARVLAVLIAVALICLIAATWHFRTLAIGDRGENFFAGLPRVFLPYLIGIALARSATPGAFRAAPIGLACALILILTVTVSGLIPIEQGWWAELAITALVFPLLIVLASQAEFPRRMTVAAQTAGDLSYPLYAVHLPMSHLVIIASSGWLERGPFLLAATVGASFGGAELARRSISNPSSGRRLAPHKAVCT